MKYNGPQFCSECGMNVEGHDDGDSSCQAAGEFTEYKSSALDRKQVSAASRMKKYAREAKKGSATSQYYLAKGYAEGDGVEQDMEKAMKWYLQAAEKGDDDAQYCLAEGYAEGDGVEQDMAKAVEWYRKAANSDNIEAQLKLGKIYETGDGATRDIVEAVKWYRSAVQWTQWDSEFEVRTFMDFYDSEAVKSFLEIESNGCFDDDVDAYKNALVAGEVGDEILENMNDCLEWYKEEAHKKWSKWMEILDEIDAA